MSRKTGVQELFYMSRQMIKKLNDLAMETGISRDKDILLTDHPAIRFSAAGINAPCCLDFLEQNLYRYTGRAFKGHRIHPFVSDPQSLGRDCICHTLHGRKYQKKRSSIQGYGGYNRKPVQLCKRDDSSVSVKSCAIFLDDKKSILKIPWWN